MIDGLTVANLKKGTKLLEHRGDAFSLCTCQRTIVLGLGLNPIKYIENDNSVINIYNGKNAYEFLLETILGLKSEVLAEYEVVNQFKDAYQNYLKSENRNSHIISILEKLFKDHKKIRSEHLMELGQLSYAGIARKIIHLASTNNKVLILGSGTLANDLVNLLKKKYSVDISGRNSDAINTMVQSHNIESVEWMNLKKYKDYAYIVNTIGADEILFNESFFNSWQSQNLLLSNKLFIDLGSPSVIQTSLTKKDGVLRLDDIFAESTKLNIEKMVKIENAKIAIQKLSDERHQNFTISFPFGWEELQFA